MNPTRKSLLLKIRDLGNRSSWAEFTRLYGPMISRYALSSGASQQVCEDIVQEVLLTVVRHCRLLEAREASGSFRRWLRAVTQHKVIDWSRRQRRIRRIVELSLEGQRLADLGQEEPLQGSRDAQWHRLEVALERVRRTTSSSAWRCFEEHVLKRRRASEVGLEMQLSENAVYIKCSRVFNRLRRYCRQALQEPSHAE